MMEETFAPSSIIVHTPGTTPPTTPLSHRADRSSSLSDQNEASIPDLLLRPAFLLPFLSLTTLTLICFGVVRGMCFHNVPGNCKLDVHVLLVQQILASVERVFLVVAVSDMSYLWSDALVSVAACNRLTQGGGGGQQIHWWNKWRGQLLRPFLLHLVALVSCIVVSAGLTDVNVRQGMKPIRIIVALVLLVILLPPLIYLFIHRYSPKQRLKSLVIFGVYLVFLIANAGLSALHVHHWTWGYIYIAVLYPPTIIAAEAADTGTVTINAAAAAVVAGGSASSSVTRARIMDEWARIANLIAFGILAQGLAAYGSSFFFMSTPAYTI